MDISMYPILAVSMLIVILIYYTFRKKYLKFPVICDNIYNEVTNYRRTREDRRI